MTTSPVSEYSEQLMLTGFYGGFSGFLGSEHGMVLMMRMANSLGSALLN